MDISEIQPVQNEPALFFKKRKILIIGDIHIGIEKELRELGFNISNQTQKIKDKLIKICNKLNVNEIILLGDIKHNIPYATITERNDVRNFLLSIQEYGVVHIIPGNHDGFIHKLSSKNIIIHSSEGFIIEKIGFIHGHRSPSVQIMKCNHVIIGHTHPTVMFFDKLNHKSFEQCWVKAKLIKDKIKVKYPDTKYPEILIIPAFNSLAGGIAINQSGISGPLGKFIDIKNAQIYLIDGSNLGKLKDIK